MNGQRPNCVTDVLDALCVEGRSPAYLCIDSEGKVASRGGHCERYGLAELDVDAPASAQLDYIEGLLPLDGSSLELPLIQVIPETYADLHLFSDDAGDWILYLDATPHAVRIYEVQQQSNELSLLRREQTEMLELISRNNDDLLAILNQLKVITAVVSADDRIEFLSDSGNQFLPKGEKTAIGKRWDEMLPILDDDTVRIRELLKLPEERRERISVRALTGMGRHYVLDIDVKDDPREEGRRIFYIYDVTEVYDLRQLLHEKAEFEDIVGGSELMTDVFQMIRDIARVDATTLIEGETGTGKELVARAIHNASPRKDQPLIIVNSAGLSDSLINSQLFGHKKGAFTDASSDQEGFFEAADGGTIFLDEIGDIPMNTQTRILRALEQKEVMRIGETTARKVDVRIIAATNKNLEEEVKNGTFRLDLLYRLKIARVQLPTLRERCEDIPMLVDTFLGQARAATGKTISEINQDAMQMLMDYSWPGNVRELKNAISFAAIHCKGPSIHAKDLPPEITGAPAKHSLRREYTVDTEKDRIMKALEACDGNRGDAAKMLGIGRATLYRRMKACMIRPSDLPKGAGKE
jgi:DNA-binding NtrC family response regulator